MVPFKGGTSASAMNHGSCSIIEELLTFNRGSEFYRYDGPIPDYFVGVSYREAVKVLIDKGIILIAVETENTEELRRQLRHDLIHIKEEARALVINPQSQYNLQQGDALFVIAESKPHNL